MYMTTATYTLSNHISKDREEHRKYTRDSERGQGERENREREVEEQDVTNTM